MRLSQLLQTFHVDRRGESLLLLTVACAMLAVLACGGDASREISPSNQAPSLIPIVASRGIAIGSSLAEIETQRAKMRDQMLGAAESPDERAQIQHIIDNDAVITATTNRRIAQLAGNYAALGIAQAELQRRTFRAAGPTSYPAAVALVDRLPVKNARAVVLRRVTAYPHDVILLSRNDVNGIDLASATSALLADRATNGIIPTRDHRLVIGHALTPGRAKTATLEKKGGKVIAQLRGETPRLLSGVGNVAWHGLLVGMQQSSMTDAHLVVSVP